MIWLVYYIMLYYAIHDGGPALFIVFLSFPLFYSSATVLYKWKVVLAARKTLTTLYAVLDACIGLYLKEREKMTTMEGAQRREDETWDEEKGDLRRAATCIIYIFIRGSIQVTAGEEEEEAICGVILSARREYISLHHDPHRIQTQETSGIEISIKNIHLAYKDECIPQLVHLFFLLFL